MADYTFSRLLSIMERLRSDNGCPWDKKQTHESILKCLVEEAYEFIEAVYLKDANQMKEELGDVLLQVIFHSQIARENGFFSIQEVIQGLGEKLVRRHPHVFGTRHADSAEGVIKIWDQVKNKEKENNRDTILAGITSGLPPLIKAEKIQRRVRNVGFEWKDFSGPLKKVREELEELEKEIKKQDQEPDAKTHVEEELGDLLFSLVNLARHLHVDPSGALEKINLAFIARFEKMEELFKKENKDIRKQSLQKLEEYWEKAKKEMALR